MYTLLADTYNLDADERKLLDELGVQGYCQSAGSDDWAREVAGSDRWDTLDNLTRKLDADSQQLLDFALWFRTSTCHVPAAMKPDALACPPGPRGCRRTMGIGCFPFWPVDDRCCDCIRDGAFGRSQPLIKQEMAASKLREILRAGSAEHVNVPHLSQLTGGIVTLLGGVEGLTRSWKEAIDEVKEKPELALRQYNQIAKMIQSCNEMESSTQSAMDAMSDEQLRDHAFRLLMSRLTADQVQSILSGIAEVPQRDMGRLSYGQA